MRVLLDTNIWLLSIPRTSKYRPIFDNLIKGTFELIISNEILSKYLEIIEQKTNATIANNIDSFLLNSPYVDKIDVCFNWNLITKAPCDNKFVDCAIAGNANYIVTNDQRFSKLKEIDFPQVDVIDADEFQRKREKLTI